MKLNILFFLILILTFTKLVGQTKTIKVTSINENQPLQNVLIYNRADIIGETDKTGRVTLHLDLVDSLTFVKNGYVDIVLAKNQLKEQVTLIKNQEIILNEVVITPMNAKVLLKKVTNFYYSKDEEGIQKAQPSYNLPHNLQVYNKFMANEDTLHYLNNRFTVYKNIFKVNDQTKIIKNFKNINNKDNMYKTYSWENKKINFPELISLTPLGVNYSIEFTNFFFHQDLFDYKIVEDDAFYKLEFKQKRKASFFNIEGYLIIDKFDYGIYEFESKLLNDKPFLKKEINFSTSKPLVFKVLMDTYHFKYVKEEGRYILDNSNKNTTFIEEKGDFKQIVFKSIIQVERTKNFNDKNQKEFDVFKWEFK